MSWRDRARVIDEGVNGGQQTLPAINALGGDFESAPGAPSIDAYLSNQQAVGSEEKPSGSWQTRARVVGQEDVAPTTPPSELGHQAARLGRNVVGGAASLLDLGRIVGDPAYEGIAYLAEKMGDAETAAKFRGYARQPTFSEQAKGAYDEVTGGAGKPQNALESATDFASEFAVGAMTPAAMQKVTTPLVRGVKALAPSRVAASTFGVDPKRVAELEQAGLPVNVPAASNSAPVKTLANLSAELPGGGAIKKSMNKAYKMADGSLAEMGFTGNVSPSDAGRTVDNAFARWQANGKARFSKLDDKLKAVVPDTSPTDVGALDGAIKIITSEPGITARQAQERMAHPALKELSAVLDDAAQGGGNVPFGSLKEARTKVGDMLTESAIKGKKDALADRAYGVLSDMMREGVRQQGGDKAVRLFDVRNKAYAQYIDENKSFVAKLRKKVGDTPESIYSTLTSGEKVGASNAARVMSKLDATERDFVRDAIITQKGTVDGQFNVQRWVDSYNKMSPDAKKVFFTGKPELRAAHDSLARGLANYKDVGKFGNPSRSGFITVLAAAITGGPGAVAGGLTGAAQAVAGGYAANVAFSKLMSSPSAVKWMAKGAILNDQAAIAAHMRKAPQSIKALLSMSLAGQLAQPTTRILIDSPQKGSEARR